VAESHTAIVAGHICLDIIPDLGNIPHSRFDSLFLPGHLIEVGQATLSTGGPVSNTGLALNKLGIPTQLMGKVGDDLFGQAVRQIVTSHGSHLADGMIVDEQAHTSYTVILSPPGVDRVFLHCPGANDTFTADDVRYDLCGQARLFHFGYPPLMKRMYENGGAQLVETYRRAKETGVTTSLDMAVPDTSSDGSRADWASILRSTLRYVDVFIPSIDEILYMLRRETFEELQHAAKGAKLSLPVMPELLSDLGRQLIEMGVKIVGLKLGNQGLYMRTADRAAIEDMGRACSSDPAAWADREMWVPCFQVEVVGTTGAGDATIAGFLGALLRDYTPEAAMTAAVAVGACNVEAVDALSGIRPWEETMQRVEAGWPRRTLTLDSPGWRFDENHHLWVRL
jgi:sugar/nucleoside kinase (ribokinase family)